MFKTLDKADFMALRTPFESSRQSPQNLGFILLVTIPFNLLFFLGIYFILGDRVEIPYQDIIFKGHLIITVIISILSIIFAIPSVYMRFQKLQYLLTIILSQAMFTLNAFIAVLFLLKEGRGILISDANLKKVAIILVITGILVFIVTSIRFYYLLKSGAYRSGSNKDIIRKKFEAKQLFLPLVIAATGLSLMLQNTQMNFMMIELETLVLLLSGTLLYFIVIFVLPEQLVLLYCKIRFNSFNYNLEGELIPSNFERSKTNEL